jgi:hypothetical protein
MKTIALPFSLAFLAASRVIGAEEATPEVIAKRQLEAMRELNWEQAARHTHPKALEQLKSLFLPVAIAGSARRNNPAAEEMMRTVFGGKTADELATQQPAAFFVLIMNGIAGATPDFKRAMTGMEIVILGHVNESDSLAHVVYRLNRTVPGGVATKIAVTSVERDGSAWKALLNADLENVARAISTRLSSSDR